MSVKRLAKDVPNCRKFSETEKQNLDFGCERKESEASASIKAPRQPVVSMKSWEKNEFEDDDSNLAAKQFKSSNTSVPASRHRADRPTIQTSVPIDERKTLKSMIRQMRTSNAVSLPTGAASYKNVLNVFVNELAQIKSKINETMKNIQQTI